MTFVLALDQGTTGSAALVFDAAGAVRGSADREITQSYPASGQVEHDPFAALERLLNGRDPLARELRRTLGRYAVAMKIRRDLLPPLLTLAWAGYCLNKFRHLERDETGHFARARVAVRKILGTPATVLSGDGDTE